METTATSPMTAEEFFDWANRPENAGNRFELDDGEVIEMPSPGEIHAMVCWYVITLLTDYVRRRGAGQILTNDCGLVVKRKPDTVRGPDVMFFSETRTLAQAVPGHFERVPTLIVEVMSPSDTLRQITKRVRQYLTREVPLVWVIDPPERVVYVHTPNGFTRDLDDTDELTGNGVLPDFRCRVADLFSLPGSADGSPKT